MINFAIIAGANFELPDLVLIRWLVEISSWVISTPAKDATLQTISVVFSPLEGGMPRISRHSRRPYCSSSFPQFGRTLNTASPTWTQNVDITSCKRPAVLSCLFKTFIASPRVQKPILNSYLPVDLNHTFRAGIRLRVQARCIQPLMQRLVCRSILEFFLSCNPTWADRTLAVRIDSLTSPGSRSWASLGRLGLGNCRRRTWRFQIFSTMKLFRRALRGRNGKWTKDCGWTNT